MKIMNFESLQVIYEEDTGKSFFYRVCNYKRLMNYSLGFYRCFFVFALISILITSSYAQTLPFYNKAKYEKMLEQKVDKVLVRILGPNQAQVLIDATLDFTRTEKFKLNQNAPLPKEKDMFKWKNAGGEKIKSDYLLPGFPSFNLTTGENKSYDKEFLYPSSFVKKLDVTVMINEKVADKELANLRIVVARVLMIDANRGDSFSIIKASFAPFWQTIWYTPDTISMVLKYVVLTFMGIIAMIVVAIGFLKLAGAMSSMAKVQQNHQITMEMGKGDTSVEGVGSDFIALPNTKEKYGEYSNELEFQGHDESNQRVIINVRHDQVSFLVNMMIKEDPANVALILMHLQPSIKSEFLKNLSPKFVSEIMASMSKVRFIEPDTILTLKEEIEKRISGAVGGVSKIIETLNGVDLKRKKEVLEELNKSNSDIAVQVKKKVLLIEDLLLFTDKDLSLIISKIKSEDWASAMWDILEPLKKRIRGQMADKTWQMIEQSMSYGSPSPERIDQSMEKIMTTIVKLIQEGLIVNPL